MNSLIKLVSVYFQTGIYIPTIEKFIDLCRDCEYCVHKRKCSKETLLQDINKYGHIFCDNLGAMLYEINEETKQLND